VPDPGTASSPFLASIRWEAQRGSRGVLLEALRFTTLRHVHITTSCRKFDRFGDWYFFRLMLFQQGKMRRCLRGEDTAFADEYFYDFNP
jgi:hypothetical protein